MTKEDKDKVRTFFPPDVQRLTDCEYELLDPTAAACHNPVSHVERANGIAICIDHINAVEAYINQKIADQFAEAEAELADREDNNPAKVAVLHLKQAAERTADEVALANANADAGIGSQDVSGAEAPVLPFPTTP